MPLGGHVPVTVTANRISGYEGPIEVEVNNLPNGMFANPAVIAAGQDTAVVTLGAASDPALLNSAPASFQVTGRAQIAGRDVQHDAEAPKPTSATSPSSPSPGALKHCYAAHSQFVPQESVVMWFV